MKDYRRFISFIVLFTAGFYWLDNIVKVPYLSASIIASILFGIFILWDRFLWKKKRFYIAFLCSLATGLYDFPDLSGKWKVKYLSSYKYDTVNDKYTTKGEGVVTISQCYSTLNIEGVFGQSSKFESVIANLKQKENSRWMLVYAYRNTPADPKLSSSASGGMHMGFCYLELSDNHKKLDGFYSNDEQRKTRGKITLEKLTN